MNTLLNETVQEACPNASRILVFPFNLLSHYLRCIQLVKPLVGSYQVYIAGSANYNYWIKKNAISTFDFNDYNAEEVIHCSMNFDFSWMNKQEVERVFLEQVKAIQKYKPHVVIGDASNTLKMAAEYCGVKYISLLNGYMSKYYIYTRRLPRVHPAFKYSQKLPPNVFDKITNVAERIAFWHVHKPFRAIRKKYKLNYVSSFLNEYEGDVTLLCDVKELFPQKELPRNYKWIGPLYFNEPNVEVDNMKFISNVKKNILVSMGSTGNWDELSFLAKPPFDEFNIITSGDKNKVLKAAHIHSVPFLNNCSLMPQMDLLICHGGNGTIYQALAHGVPVLACTSIFEQDYNMQRIEELSLGERFEPTKNKIEIYEMVKKWMGLKSSTAHLRIKAKIDAEKYGK